MKQNKLMKTVGRQFHKAVFCVKRHSPEILVAAGIVGTVASAVMACRATTKISKIMNKAKEDLAPIHKIQEDESFSEEYTEKDAKRDTAIVYTQTALRVAKLYAPSVILGALSIGGIITSTNILKKRNIALAAAYAAADKGFKEYRERVRERFGEETERGLRYNIKAKEIAESVKVDGEDKTETKTIEVADESNGYSAFARFFDESCAPWEKSAEYNLAFLNSEQHYANDRLQSRGYLFLNEVYERLGLKPTKAGQIVGWIYDPDNPKHIGDNFVDFGIYNLHRERSRDFVNGYERSILLDFNVDGPILNRLEGVVE